MENRFAKDRMLLGSTMRKRRKALGMSLAQMALLTGITPKTIASIELGKTTVRLETLLGMLTMLGLGLALQESRTAFAIEERLL